MCPVPCWLWEAYCGLCGGPVLGREPALPRQVSPASVLRWADVPRGCKPPMAMSP